MGLLNAAESFLRGNWLAAGSTARNVFRAVMAPLWLPLNGLRALVAGVFTLFALPVIAILHNLNKSNLQASIAESKEVATVAAVKTANLAKVDPSLAQQRDEAIRHANHALEAGSQGLASVAKKNADAASAIANSSAALVSKKLNGESKPQNVAVMTDFRERNLHPVKVKLKEVKQALNDKAEVKKAAQDAKASKHALKPEGFFKKAKKKTVQKLVGVVFGR